MWLSKVVEICDKETRTSLWDQAEIVRSVYDTLLYVSGSICRHSEQTLIIAFIEHCCLSWVTCWSNGRPIPTKTKTVVWERYISTVSVCIVVWLSYMLIQTMLITLWGGLEKFTQVKSHLLIKSSLWFMERLLTQLSNQIPHFLATIHHLTVMQRERKSLQTSLALC